jgi:hypothetical protein
MIRSIEKSSYLPRNRTRDLPTYHSASTNYAAAHPIIIIIDVLWVLRAIFLEVKRLGPETSLSPSSSAEVRNHHSPTRLNGVEGNLIV